MSDKLRCINAFEFEGRIYPGGIEMDEDAAILETHRAHFAVATPVERTFSVVASETADAAPGTPRSITTPLKRGPGRPPKVKQQDVTPEVDPAADTKNED